MTPQEYCSQMRNKGVWGGGPEILALVNRLRRPIHVFEPVPACNGTQVQMQLCGVIISRLYLAYISPTSRLHLAYISPGSAR